ncbi:hypothetical protein AC579_3445 [Pseudocercospora musae]|uniref:Uncharacterized protein n=1 Tax=Pseudocercospora musae TaxID=113226 RepID=A0A139IC05_9PEZI|nr:hypothetical protein AC579_3445 [Pseudocercospora musae]
MPRSQSVDVPAEQRARLDEVAQLMLDIYQTLADMRYINPEGIMQGPHDTEELRQAWAKHDLDPAIIYLYSILPYIDITVAGEPDFFHGGTFANFLKPEDVERGRDPWYMDPDLEADWDDENGPYMRPWYTPLSQMGNHQSVILYDAREHRIWIIDQEGWGTTDRALCKWGSDDEEEKEKSDWGSDSDEGGYNEEPSASDSSSECGEEGTVEADELDGLRNDQAEEVEYDEGFDVLGEDEVRQAEWEGRSKNDNSFQHIRSRDASAVLRDIKKWYYELKEFPGQGEHSGQEWMKPKILKPLYVQNGWPDDFDGDAFEVSLARAYCADRAKYMAENPLRQVQCYEGWMQYGERDKERYTKEIEEGKTADEEWVSRFKLWQSQNNQARNVKDLERAKEKAERRCPGGKCQKEEDLPLWELEQLRVETQWMRESLPCSQDAVAPTTDDPEQRKHDIARAKKAEKKAAVYSKAYEAAKADAERLCPGRTFEQATGIESLGRKDTLWNIESQKYWIEYGKKELEKVQTWAKQLPENVPNTMVLVDHAIKSNERSLKSAQNMLKRHEEWLAEHGNTD